MAPRAFETRAASPGRRMRRAPTCLHAVPAGGEGDPSRFVMESTGGSHRPAGSGSRVGDAPDLDCHLLEIRNLVALAYPRHL